MSTRRQPFLLSDLRWDLESISVEDWVDALEDAMVLAAKEEHSLTAPVRSRLNTNTGEFETFIVKQVVEVVKDPQTESNLEEAREERIDAEIGEEVRIPVSTEGLRRIAERSARQVLYRRVCEAERKKIYNLFIDRVGDLTSGTVMRFEQGSIIVDLGCTEATVPKREQSVYERFKQGEQIRAVIVEVHQRSSGPQVLLSRADPRLLVRLFELEVPEITEGTVEIRRAVRVPGKRAKVLVGSRAHNVDPVGACVGTRGARVKAVIRELRKEKIDIIEYSDDLVTLVRGALAPARITRVSVTSSGERPHLDVIVKDKQLRIALGKEDQNVRLAAELLNATISIKSETEVRGEVAHGLARMLEKPEGE